MNKNYQLLIAILLILFPIILQYVIKKPIYNFNIDVIDIFTGFCIGLGINIILSHILKSNQNS